jgi:hypothetical protein
VALDIMPVKPGGPVEQHRNGDHSQLRPRRRRFGGQLPTRQSAGDRR